MSLTQQISERITTALRSGKEIEKNILRVFLGEIQKAEALGGQLPDDKIYAIARKIIKSNKETLALLEERSPKVEEYVKVALDPKSERAKKLATGMADMGRMATLEAENDILADFLPTTLDERQLMATLTSEPLLSEITGVLSDGQATGLAMKHFKQNQIGVIGGEVAKIVAEVRGMSEKDIMGFRMANRLIENPEILDDLKDRLENDEIVDWED